MPKGLDQHPELRDEDIVYVGKTGSVKILVDVDVLEELIEGYGDECAGTSTTIFLDCAKALREQIAAARKAQESHRG